MSAQTLKLLIGDNQRLFTEGLQYLLKHDLYIESALAVNGKEVIEKCNKKKFDTVIMDVNMPVIDGIQTTITIKNLYPAIKIIILSAASDLATIINALNAGADAYVLKDETSTELMKALHAVMKNEIYLSDSITHFFPKNTGDKKKIKHHKYPSESLITIREKSVLRLITEGYTNPEIADILFISVKTADTHRKNLIAKLKVSNTASLVKFAVLNKLI